MENKIMMRVEANRRRVILEPVELEAVRRAVSYATANFDDFRELFGPPRPAATTFDRLTERVEFVKGYENKLKWVPDPDSPMTAYAFLGVPGDSVLFSLSDYPSCHRRGRFRLLIEVAGGKHHHDWGCFDAADQPTRNYHSLYNALEEAELLALVLLKGREEKGPLEETTEPVEWVKPLWELSRGKA